MNHSPSPALWTELHLAEPVEVAPLRFAISMAFGLPLDAVSVVDDLAGYVDPAARVVCERGRLGGQFPLRLALHVGDPGQASPHTVVEALCRILRCHALVDDGSPNPYTWIEAHPDGRRTVVAVDAAALDERNELTIAAPPTLRSGEEGHVHALLAIYPTQLFQFPFGVPTTLVYFTLGLGAMTDAARELGPLRAAIPNSRHGGWDRPRGSLVVVSNGSARTEDLAPDRVAALHRAFHATGLPSDPPELAIEWNRTGSFGRYISFHGAANGIPFAIEYGGLEPLEIRGPRAHEWQRFLCELGI